jgi:hypothetical protein
MGISDPTPENLQAAASAFNAAYPSPYPHHTATLMMAAAEHISLLEDKHLNGTATQWPDWVSELQKRIAEQDAEIKALREQVRWVPVSERLPTESKRYEVVCRGKNNRWAEERLFLKSTWVASEYPVEYWREKQALPPPPMESGQ